MTDQSLERDQVQGLVVRGYGQMRAAAYLLGQITDPAAARAWLGRTSLGDGRPATGETALNVAFTAAGLRSLGLPEQALAQFSHEFVAGMTTAHRQRILGDVDDSAPQHWSWGAPGADAIDLVVLVFARDPGVLRAALDAQGEALGPAGIRVLRTLETAELEDREHFGFRDGISQPRLRDLGEAPDRDLVPNGELVLGYRNAYGRFTARPLVQDGQAVLPSDVEGSGLRDLGRNGSYLVLRQLSQDVEGFWSFCERAALRPDGSVDNPARARLAAKLVGRWPSGAPLTLAPDADRPGLEEANDFAYFEDDLHGMRCPLGSHVRRANPRDTLDPAPGTERSVAVNKRHRMLRRGRSYGELLPRSEVLSAGTDPRWRDVERGLHFICLVGNISRQFEFVQHSWLNDPAFNGLYDEPDPLLSPAPARGRTFTVQAEPVRERHTGLPRFVSVRGGAYFFLPSVAAVRYLATLR